MHPIICQKCNKETPLPKRRVCHSCSLKQRCERDPRKSKVIRRKCTICFEKDVCYPKAKICSKKCHKELRKKWNYNSKMKRKEHEIDSEEELDEHLLKRGFQI